MGYALHKENPRLGQKVEKPRLHGVEGVLSHCPAWKKRAANDETVSRAVLPGQYFDVETNLHYNHHRYYDPELGRYITSDPIGLTAGLNTYSYANQNSLVYYDPDGLRVIPRPPVDPTPGFNRDLHRALENLPDPGASFSRDPKKGRLICTCSGAIIPPPLPPPGSGQVCDGKEPRPSACPCRLVF